MKKRFLNCLVTVLNQFKKNFEFFIFVSFSDLKYSDFDFSFDSSDFDFSKDYQVLKYFFVLIEINFDFLFWKLKRASVSLYKSNSHQSILQQFSYLFTSNTELIMNQSFEFIFIFCECFFEKKTIFAVRWLRKLKHELISFKLFETISFEKFINSVNLLLIDDAADWTEVNMNAVHFLSEDDFIEKTMFTFKILFQKRFSAKTVKLSAVNFYAKLKEFRQKAKKSINAYHKRMLNFMSKIAV